MPHDTAVDALLADPRLQAVLEEMATRVRDRRPIRWHRLIHDTLGYQMHASPDLALVTEMHWTLARQGIPTHIVSGWLETRL